MNSKKCNALNMLFSILISLVINFQIIIVKSDYKLNFFSNVNVFKFICYFLLIFIVVLFILKLIILLYSKLNLKDTKWDYKHQKILFIISFITMVLVWSLCLITYYPGGGMDDTYTALESPIFATAIHPILFCFTFYFFTVIIGFKLFHSAIIGWALFSVFQMLIVALSISFAISFLAKRNCNKYIIIFLTLFFTLVPIYSSFSIFAIKDILFSIIILYLFLWTIKLVETDGEILHNKKYIILYVIIGTMLLLTRNNGIVTYLIMSILIFLIYRKQIKGTFLIFLLIPLIVNSSTNFLINKIYGVEHTFQESVSIPLQQLSATVYNDGKLTKETYDFMDKLIGINVIKKVYLNGNVDVIKFNKNFDKIYLQKNKIKFIKNWVVTLPNNFDTYVESYLLQVYHFWSIEPKAKISNMYYDTYSNPSDEYVEKIKSIYNIRSDNIFDAKWQNILENYYFTYTNFLSEGSMLWISFLLIILLIYKNGYKYLLVYMPLFTVWLSVIVATPLDTSLRYVLPFVYILPLLFSYVFIQNKN